MTFSDLDTLLAKARNHRMMDAEQEAQRRSFAYGNVHLHNDQITREMIDAAADRLTDQLEKQILGG